MLSKFYSLRDSCDGNQLIQNLRIRAKNLSPESPESLAVITHLEAGLIPRRTFPLRNWYYSNPLWYYHAPAFEHQLEPNSNFFELVDPLLGELCRCLLNIGFCTTPSCQGHFYSQKRFEKIWVELNEEAELIRKSGLVVKDSENDQTFLFRQTNYQIPWKNFQEFYKQSNQQQSKGYLGIALPIQHPELIEIFMTLTFTWERARIEFDAELSTIFSQPIFSIYVEARTPEERNVLWWIITQHIKKRLLVSAPHLPWRFLN